MDHITELSQNLLAILPEIQRSVEPLFISECASLALTPADIRCVVDPDVSVIRVESDRVPLIRVGHAWAFQCFITDSGVLVNALRRAVHIAHKRMRWTLSQPRQAYSLDYVPSANAWRMAHPSDMPSIPPSAFACVCTVTLSDPVSGITVSRDGIRLSDVADVRAELHSILSSRVLVDAVASEAYESLAAARELPMLPPISVDIVASLSGQTTETYHYAGEASHIEHVEQDTKNV